MSAIDRARFYKRLRGAMFPNGLTQSQVEGTELILDRWEYGFPAGDPRWLAYMLGTVCHETDRTMQPIEEYDHGGSRWYAQPDPETGLRYYGRGLVQITHKNVYRAMGDRLGKDLVNHPELACDPGIAVEILFVGMVEGRFTGVRLSTYFREDHEDWINARRIINGLDRAELVAGYAKRYLAALTVEASPLVA